MRRQRVEVSKLFDIPADSTSFSDAWSVRQHVEVINIVRYSCRFHMYLTSVWSVTERC